MVRVGRSYVNVFTFAGEPADPYERMEMVGLLLIGRLAPIEAPARPEPVETGHQNP